MYYLLNIETLIKFYLELGIDLSTFTPFQLSIVWVLSNIFALIFIMFILSIAYKVVCRFFRL